MAPLNLSNPVDLAAPVMASAFNVVGFSVNVKGSILDIAYEGGNYDESSPPVFIPVGEQKNLHIESAEFAAMLAANPTLYPGLKALLYGLLSAHLGISGTVA